MKARILAIFAASVLIAQAHAAERVTLANGFTLDCNHHALVDGHMRLYTSTDERNYVELTPAQVAAIDTVPDPPPAHAQPMGAPSLRPPLPQGWDSTSTSLRPLLSSAGHAHNLDVELLASVVQAESGGNPRALSHAGARGLMQLMPQTAAEHGVTDIYQPEQNVRGGAAYLDELLTRYHENLTLALAAYNAGPEAVDRYHGIPPYYETRAYVARVIREFNRRVSARQHTAVRASE